MLDRTRVPTAGTFIVSPGRLQWRRFQYKMMRRDALLERLPGKGPDVVGASFSPLDGHVNPLLLLRALHTAFKRKSGELRHETVIDIQHHEQKFGIRTTSG